MALALANKNRIARDLIALIAQRFNLQEHSPAKDKVVTLHQHRPSPRD